MVVSSLVAHHMTHDQLVAFLRFMEAESAMGWLVNDLHRHGFAHWGFPILARTFGWHRIVRLDGTLSIARSYRPAEWPPILAEAGVPDARVYRAFPVPAVRRTPALIVGGGPAGAAAALLLARARVAASADRAHRRDRRRAVRRVPELADARDARAHRHPARRAQPRRYPPAAAVRGQAQGRGMAAAPGARGVALAARHACCSIMRSPPARRSSAASRCAAPKAIACASPTTARSPPTRLFLATGKHDLRGLARPVDAWPTTRRSGLRVRLGPSRRRSTGWSAGRSSCTCSTAAMPGWRGRRTGRSIAAWRCIARG